MCRALSIRCRAYRHRSRDKNVAGASAYKRLGRQMLSVGVDIVEIGRLSRIYERWGQRFLDRVYSPREQSFCRGRLPELAARFAAKEAISKALGTGIVGRGGVNWLDMEVLPDRRGKPLVYLHGRARERAQELGLNEWAISLSHERTMAVAFVAASSAREPAS
jgi:holo-[acyl-carrier protein] synthase